MIPVKFTIGDLVETVDDTTKGRVVESSADWVTIETPDGFRLRYKPSELLLLTGQQRLSISSSEVAQARSLEEKAYQKKQPPGKRKERNAPKMEVDLHIHQLVSHSRGMNKHDILNLQVDTARRQLEFAIGKRIQKVVFIHGVGEGTLKEELKYLFGRYPVDYYDADYQKYGLGATEVYIYQNAKLSD